MEVVAAAPGGGGVPPFHDHDVREWSRIDSLTGVLERARLETDHWAANTNNSSHKYGKVVDSRARTDADGALQQKARRQLEVYQSQIPGGHLQVIKSHTVSSSRWSSNKSTIQTDVHRDTTKDFENLELSLNSLDLSSQKSKANVGRSVGRRPPSRPRAKDESSTTNPLRNAQQTAATNLYRVSRLCHQLHEDTVKQTFGKYYQPPKSKLQNGNGSSSGVEIHEIESVSSDNNEPSTNGHPNLLRTKSTSSEDLLLTSEKDKSNKSTEDLEDLEQLQSWRRSSKVRRSLQYPKQTKQATPSKPLDLPESNGSVRKIREELEKGRRLSTALRGNNVDLEALDQILQSISSSSDRASPLDDSQYDFEQELQSLGKKQKRNSFVTVETLQEVKGRLRHTNTEDAFKSKPEEIDDGVVTEDTNELKNEMSSPTSKVRSYVYGMESMLNKKPLSGTGSLESRSKALNGNLGLRSEDWYNRRKSYGFEQVHNQNETSNSISLRTKGRVESSTDSGICKSSEMVPNTPNKIATPRTKFTYESDDTSSYNSVKKMSSIFDKGLNKESNCTYLWDKTYPKSTTITIPIVAEPKPEWKSDVDMKRHSIAVDESKYVTTNHNDNKFRRTSLAVNERLSDLDDPSNQNRKSKKVEFCKTEVHFAAESGKVKIVETDEKPPPTHNFRRRRRNSGPINDGSDLLLGESRNDLPVLHFGDSSYEKSLLGVKSDDSYSADSTEKTTIADENIYENLQHKFVPCGTVTVNTAPSDVREDEKRDYFIENDSIKGILKNKPIRPTPYHLGENETSFLLNHCSDKDANKWGVKLKPVGKAETPYWKSTVTLSNTVYGNDPAASNENVLNGSTGKNPSEFQILLKNLKPTNSAKPDLIENQDRMSPSIKFVTSEDNRPPWSVADKVKLSEKQWNENRTYSTKINFGDGGTAIIENDDLKRKQQDALWSRRKSPVKDSKQMLSKGLVVRIGKEDSKHAVCSKTTSQKLCNTTTTTTKITIDLNSPVLNSKLKESQTVPADLKSHSFKSTSLILNTIKNDNKEDTMRIPHQLEALKKLYENVHSDSDADEEVQKLMEKMEEKQSDHIQVDNSSVLSGSWSRMRAYKSITEHYNKSSLTQVNKSANIEKEAVSNDHLYGYDSSNSSRFSKTSKTEDMKKLKNSEIKSSLLTSSYKNNSSLSTKLDLKTATVGEKLSSPSLVGRNSKVDLFVDSPTLQKESEFANISDVEIHRKHTQKDIVLRQPKKSEMTYFGINISPKQEKKKSETVIHSETNLTEKPDLLQHMKIDDESRYSCMNKTKPRKNSPTNALPNKESPIYENIINSKPKTKNRYSREFDSNILNELTLAADQILKAVSDFAEEDSKNQSKETNKIPLDTISERKSWTQDKKFKRATAPTSNKPLVKSKLNHHSSTSSVESISRDDGRLSSPARKHSQTTIGSIDKLKKKPTSSDSSSTKINTKARRLQRASSREALLQSRGSSSEDLGGNVVNPQRKPRQIKKTKSIQMTVTNGVELNKKTSQIPNPPTRRRKEDVKSSSKERTTEALPEVRHKTAVSTIKSTTEKSSREHSKPRINELKRKVTQDKKDNHNKGSSLSSRTDPGKDAVTRETVNHRISTANIKKCHRTERSTKH